MKLTIRFGKNNSVRVFKNANGCEMSLNRYLSENKLSLTFEKAEERDLLRRIQQDKDKSSEAKLFQAHSKAVIALAKQLHSMHKAETRVASLNDFIQWGNFGLIEAMYTFDLTYECKFLSHAAYCMYKHMERGFSKVGETIYLPASQKKLLKSYRRQEFLDDEKIVEKYIGNYDVLSGTAYDFLSKHTKAATLIPRQYHGLNDSVSSFISSDDLMSVETHAEELLFSDDNPEEKLLHESFNIEIARALNTLTDREREILVLFFGLQPLYEGALKSASSGDHDKEEYYQKLFSTELGLEEIGTMFNIMPERVRQIKDKALQRLRNTDRSKFLVEYLG